MEFLNKKLDSVQLEKLKNDAEHIRMIANNLITKLSKDLVEREEVLRLSFLCAMSGESIFMLGPPGIAKSLVSRKIQSVFRNAKSFEVLMNRYSTPDEIFGPIDITELKKGKYSRKVEGYLPDCNIGFLDEIWKASSSIQNALLMIINEKLFINDGVSTKVDLALLIAASNELPERGKGLEALWDRFIIRLDMKPIQNDDKFLSLFSNPTNLLDKQDLLESEKFDLSILQKVSKNSEFVEIPLNIKKFIILLRRKIEEFNKKFLEKNEEADAFDLIYVSDRKWKKIAGILRNSAYLNGRMYVDISDCFILENIIWNNEKQIPEIKLMIEECASSIEYGIEGKYSYSIDTFNKIREAIIDNIALHEVKSDVIIKSYKNKDNTYYYFMDAEKNKFFFKKDDIDNIPRNENFEMMDWLLTYSTAEEFKTSQEGSKKALLKYDGTNFFTYRNNDENGEKIKIYTNFEEKNVDHYRLQKPTVDFIRDVKNTATLLIEKINADIDNLRSLKGKKFELFKLENLFIELKDLGFLKEKIEDSIKKLEDVVDKVKDMFVYVKLINYGFTTKDKNKILPSLEF
ncbi:MAG: AAA family ATPase [Malacoplasma sp.]